MATKKKHGWRIISLQGHWLAIVTPAASTSLLTNSSILTGTSTPWIQAMAWYRSWNPVASTPISTSSSSDWVRVLFLRVGLTSLFPCYCISRCSTFNVRIFSYNFIASHFLSWDFLAAIFETETGVSCRHVWPGACRGRNGRRTHPCRRPWRYDQYGQTRWDSRCILDNTYLFKDEKTYH